MTGEVRSRGRAVAGSGLGMTRRRRLLVTGFVALAFYAYAWTVQPNRPQLTAVFATPPKLPTVLENGIRPSEAGTPAVQYQAHRWGWYAAWYDQFHYARMARAIARGQLPGVGWDAKHMVQKNPSDPHEIASFSYGLGYPAVGAVFYGLGFHGDPFVVPDGLLFALAAMLALIVAERVLSPVTAFVVVNVLVLTAPLVRYFVIPYGTSLTAVAVLLGLVLVTGDRFDWKLGAAFGVVAALTFAARYADLVWLVVLVSIPLVRRWRESWRVIVAFASAIAVAAVIVLWAQDRAFGDPFTTPYHFVHNGLDASWKAYRLRQIPKAAVGVFLTGDRSKLFGIDPIVRDFPWLVLAPFGLVSLFLRRHPLRFVLLLATVAGVASSISYLAWVFGDTADLPYWIIRFHTSWFFLWAILAGVVVDRLLLSIAGADAAWLSQPATTVAP